MFTFVLNTHVPVLLGSVLTCIDKLLILYKKLHCKLNEHLLFPRNSCNDNLLFLQVTISIRISNCSFRIFRFCHPLCLHYNGVYKMISARKMYKELSNYSAIYLNSSTTYLNKCMPAYLGIIIILSNN